MKLQKRIKKRIHKSMQKSKKGRENKEDGMVKIRTKGKNKLEICIEMKQLKTKNIM